MPVQVSLAFQLIEMFYMRTAVMNMITETATDAGAAVLGQDEHTSPATQARRIYDNFRGKPGYRVH